MQLKSICKTGTTQLALAALLSLSACAMPVWMPLLPQTPGSPLAQGEAINLHFFTNEANFETGIALQSGRGYTLTLALLSNWIDSNIDTNEDEMPLNERGFADSQMPYEFVSRLKRSRQHRWFELMLYQADCKEESLRGVSDLSFDVESNTYNFVASCDGNLTLFVNDSPGFYGNNVGYANISLSRVN
jgi:hypothetical protein